MTATNALGQLYDDLLLMIDNTWEYDLSLEMYYTVNIEICTLLSPRLHVRDFSVVINSRVRCR